MSRKLPRIAAEIMNRPLLCEQGYVETMLHFLGERVGVDNSSLSPASYEARDFSPSERVGVAHIPIIGSLTHRAGFLDAESGMTSYDSISSELDRAVAAGVGTILLEIDSPGGMVSGAFDLADKIFAIANDESKPRVVAFARDSAMSAAYLLGSQANEFYGTQTAQVGSIGVVVAHYDRSKQLEMAGIKPTFIFAGDQKIDGTSALPLPDDVRERIQGEINETYEMFVAAVASGREMDEAAVRDTQAGIMKASAAVEANLLDGVMTMEQVLEIASMAPQTRGVGMSRETMYTQAQLDERVEAARSEAAKAAAEAATEAVTAERARISTIMSSEAWNGREALGKKMISKGMSAEDAIDIMMAAPVEKSSDARETARSEPAKEPAKAEAGAAQKKALEALASDNPDVGPDVADDGKQAAASATVDPQAQREAEARAEAKKFAAARRMRRG